MTTKSIILTQEERDVLILVVPHIGEKHLSNSEIARRLGISVSKVKTLIHQACLKLQARNRVEAIHLAIKRGGMSASDFYSLDEIAEMISSIGPDILNEVAQYMVRQKNDQGHT